MRIRSLDGTAALELEHPEVSRRGFRCDATLLVDDAAHVVALDMIESYRRFWLAYFDDLAASSAGCTGAKCWSSEFHELTLEARREAGEVRLTAVLEADDAMADEPTATLRLRPSDLGRFRDELARFLHLPK